MTSEVLVMNELGMAMAADSASVVDNKVFAANKLHPLSGNEPVAIMAYGNGTVDGVPFELLVGEYRRRLGEDGFDTLHGYAEDFQRFLGSEDCGRILSRGYEDTFVVTCLSRIARDEFAHWREMDPHTVANDDTVGRLFEELRVSETRELSVSELDERADDIRASIARVKADGIDPSRDVFLGNRMVLDEVIHILAGRIVTGKSVGIDTGIVIAGYGRKDVLPSYEEQTIHGIFNSTVSRRLVSEGRVDGKNRSVIRTFAQDNTVKALIEGMDPSVSALLREALCDVMASIVHKQGIRDVKISRRVDDIVDSLVGKLTTGYRAPIERMMTHLLPEDMAEFAESLVNATSLKARISRIESVGGPTDVAIVSKDGFEWFRGDNAHL